MLTSLFQFMWFLLVSFYSLSFLDINNNVVNTQRFQGKKVLLVNIASNSPQIKQLNGLQQLQQQFKDSLVVVVFPSNSFGNEPKNNNELKQFLEQNYNLNFIIASKTDVTGNNKNPIYEWLAKKNYNGYIDATTGADFVKYLIDKDGKFMGMFSSKIQPMDSSIIQTINTTY
jgi:glutathione peroxidase